MRRILLLALWTCGMLWAAMGAATQATSDLLQLVDFDQRLNGLVPLDLGFQDELGRRVRLADYVDGKPVILLLAYYRCPNLCGLAVEGLAETLKQVAFGAGADYRVVVASIDPRDTPAAAAEKKAGFAARYPTIGMDAGWRFLSGDEENIRALAASVGFRYAYDPALDQYVHATGIVLLTGEGRIARYLYGVRFAPRDLRLGLVETADGRIGSPIDRLLLRCYAYDPATGRYSVLVLNVLRLAGAATLALLGGFVGLMLRRERRARRRRQTSVAGDG